MAMFKLMRKYQSLLDGICLNVCIPKVNFSSLLMILLNNNVKHHTHRPV